MAGIAGIVLKNPRHGEERLGKAFASMMQKLFVSDSQMTHKFTATDICFGNVMPVSCRKNDHFQYNDKLEIHAVIDGLVFVDRSERSTLTAKYNITGRQTDYYLIPYLYDLYKEDFVSHVTGWFNIFVYNEKKSQSLLVNDHFGLLPLFYHESDSCFIFASKIEAVLSSGMLSSVKPDPVTIAERLFFNYPLSDHTYIENIFTLSNAHRVKIGGEKTSKERYWSMADWYDYPPVGKDESFHLLNDGLAQSVSKMTAQCEGKLNMSLTGGWDSRVVLSYCLPEHKDRLNLYSFGAEQSDDILVPKHIGRAENLAYTSYILDQEYLKCHFIPNAIDTILLSSGARNYKRTHYLYTAKKICKASNYLLTGIFGDEVFKVGKPSGGEVLSRNAVSLLQTDFDLDKTVAKFLTSPALQCLNTNRDLVVNGFRERIESIEDRMKAFESISQKYYCFRFEYNLRKYFGAEINSYNDFVFCFSPFIDQTFLNKFAHSRFFGIHYDFNSSSIHLKKQSARLYHDIVQANYSPLTGYPSDRGYTMKDAANPMGNLKLLYRKYIKRRKKVDAFNTGSTGWLFASFIENRQLRSNIFNSFQSTPAGNGDPNILSLFFWLAYIEQKNEQ